MTVPSTHDGRASSSASWRPLRPLPSVSTVRASTFTTPRCWNCAPSERKTAPTRASGMPMNELGSSAICSERSLRSGSHATTLPVRPPISLANGRAPHPHHRRSGAALPRRSRSRPIDDDLRTLVARHVRDDGCRARRRARRTAGRRAAAAVHLRLGRRGRRAVARRRDQPRAVDHAAAGRRARRRRGVRGLPLVPGRAVRAAPGRARDPARDRPRRPAVRDRAPRAGSPASSSTSTTTSTACSTPTASARRTSASSRRSRASSGGASRASRGCRASTTSRTD